MLLCSVISHFGDYGSKASKNGEYMFSIEIQSETSMTSVQYYFSIICNELMAVLTKGTAIKAMCHHSKDLFVYILKYSGTLG